MNPNPNTFKVLCYGDSNTWGQKPDKTGRYPADIRWTGILKKAIGDRYYVIEEGLSSRTTDLEYSAKPGRNGKSYLQPCLESHNPIDIVLLMLGTNDLKMEYNRSAKDVSNAIAGLANDIKKYAKNAKNSMPKIVLISPTPIRDKARLFKEFYTGLYDHKSALKSKDLADQIDKIAFQNGCFFVDSSKLAVAGEDGVHMNEESHQKLGNLMANVVKTLSGSSEDKC
jgi:lysophospholipase L1-like esterase